MPFPRNLRSFPGNENCPEVTGYCIRTFLRSPLRILQEPPFLADARCIIPMDRPCNDVGLHSPVNLTLLDFEKEWTIIRSSICTVRV